jgi:LacI family gluconate utilization system Gnt-I transcriptional repressor
MPDAEQTKDAISSPRSESSASATIRDVAERAGVSLMTVSRAFSAPKTVATSTLARIEAAANDVGYVPHRLAGALRSGTSRMVAAIVPSLENSLFAGFLQGLSDGLAQEGILLTAGDASRRAGDEDRLVSEYLTLRPRALVLHETSHSAETVARLRRLDVPVVEVGDLVDDPIQHNLSFSNRAAAAALTAHLVQTGRRRIGFLTLPPSASTRAARRLDGYRDALESAGIALDETLIVEGVGGYAGAIAATEALLASGARPDAIIGAGDVFAIGALLACQKAGMRVPADIAIASFDDHEICSQLSPPLTALSIPRREIGMRTANLILGLGRRQPVAPIREDVGFKLTLRGSTLVDA